MLKNKKIAVIGLGYVGLPLLVELSKKYNVKGFDLSKKRIAQLKSAKDITNEVDSGDLNNLGDCFTHNVKDIKEENVYIITVPTPITKKKEPELSPLKIACDNIGKSLKKGDLVIFESTVYPGLTEEFCVPILENISRLKLNKDFMVGYSPERINPGDNNRKLTDIRKITSGSNAKALKTVDGIYKSIIKAGTYPVKSIKVAEAAKVIENTQRDINIALVNELSLLFKKLDIDTNEVIDAAATKWNFLDFRPGLVGGHCIGVDPYYLTYKAKEVGFEPKMILSGRQTNELIPDFISNSLLADLKKKKINYKDARILILGLTFKEDCPDMRNSKVKEIYNYLNSKLSKVDVFDPRAQNFDLLDNYRKESVLTKMPVKKKFYDSILLAVPHKEFKQLGFNKIKGLGTDSSLFYDLKNAFPNKKVDFKL
jgi:UDP-N-acetyl-D-galactosamine dehydrogenase